MLLLYVTVSKVPGAQGILFQFLKSNMQLLSFYCDIFHLSLIPNIHWRRFMFYWNRKKKRLKWENQFHHNATDVLLLSKHWVMYSIGFRGKILSGLGDWGRRELNILIRLYCYWSIQILQHQDVLEIPFLLPIYSFEATTFKTHQMFHFSILSIESLHILNWSNFPFHNSFLDYDITSCF